MMKLIKKSPYIWIIQANQKLANVIGSLFLVIGIVGNIYLNYPYYISCAIKQPRVAQKCTVFNPFARLFGIKQSYSQIDKAKIILRSNKNQKEYSLRLYTPIGNHFIKKIFNHDRHRVKFARDSINHYIKYSSAQQMTIPDYTPIYPRLILIFFIPFSLVFLYISASRTIVIDKHKQQLSLGRKFLGLMTLGKKQIFPFQSINHFVVVSSCSRKNGHTYQLMCQLSDGNHIAINTVTDGDEKRKQSLAEELNAFVQSSQK